jgi:hypothetical protein
MLIPAFQRYSQISSTANTAETTKKLCFP